MRLTALADLSQSLRRRKRLTRRERDLKTIARWRALGILGDPPAFVQRAFDNESIRRIERMVMSINHVLRIVIVEEDDRQKLNRIGSFGGVSIASFSTVAKAQEARDFIAQLPQIDPAFRQEMIDIERMEE